MSAPGIKLSPPELELEYRAWEWEGAMRRARVAIVTASAVFLLFLYPDYLFFGLDWRFGGLLALRLSIIALGATSLWALTGPPRPRRFDALISLWTAWAGLLTAVILPATRPNAWILHGFIVCVAIPAIYLVVPLTFRVATLIGVGMAIGYLAFVVVTNSDLAYMQGVVVGFSLFAANVFGLVTNRWLHQSQRASFLQERSLRRAEENLATLVDAVPVPVALLDLATGHVRRLNDAARTLFAGHAEGGPELVIERLAAESPTLASMHRLEPGAAHEIATADGAGQTRWLLVSSRPIAHDSAPCTLLSFVDITARKATEDSLARAKRDADDANRAKSTFLATMSHEIRTPLHGVLGAVQLLERAQLGATEREHVDTIRFCARGVLELVDGILDLSRAEAGVITPLRAAFDPRTLARNLVESLASRGTPFDVRLDDSLAPTLIGDEARIRRVLLNLLDNALKYGDQTPIALEIRAEHGGIAFAVDNGGAPIPADQRAAIFEPFVQLEHPDPKARRGFGLGLAICRREVEAMGGTLVLASPTAEGRTRFSFTLPLEPGPARIDNVPAAPRRTPRPLSLLVVEDDAVSARLARALLEGSGHRVTLVTNGSDALKMAAERAFDVILMDMRLPGLGGVEVTRRIRALPDLARATVPIIATTANAMVEERARYREAGISVVAPKPIDFDVLEGLLSEVAGLAALDDAPIAGPARVAQSHTLGDATRPLIDEALLARYARTLGAQSTRELLALCVDTAQPLVVAIEQAAELRDAAAVARHAHQLASAAHSAAFARLGDAAAHVEGVAREGGGALASAVDRLDRAWRGTLTAYATFREGQSAATATPSR